MVDNGAALIAADFRTVTVALGESSPVTLTGEGWKLELAPAWTLAESARPGDLAPRLSGEE